MTLASELAAIIAAAAAGLALLRPLRTRVGVLTGLAVGGSVAATALAPERLADPGDVPYVTAEIVAMLGLLFLNLRDAPTLSGVAILAVLAAIVAIAVPASDADLTEKAAWLGVWLAAVALSAGAATYLNWVDRGRRAAVAAARRRERLELARDLHDFVAHDVSAIVAQAQAAQYAGRTDPNLLMAALGRIEDAGTNALGSMDRTVRMLHEAATGEDDDAVTERAADLRRRSLEDLSDLVRRFEDSGPVRVTLDQPPGSTADLPADISLTAYRVVVEALTNIRRHAPEATNVRIATSRRSEPVQALEVSVANDVAAGPLEPRIGPSDREGGRGLIGLRDRVETLGGSFQAGPSAGGWRVVARLPLGEAEVADR